MKHSKLLSIILAVCMLASIITVPAFAAVSDVGYKLVGHYGDTDGSYDLDVYIANVNALSGRIAISFDTSKLQLAGISNYSDAVKPSNGITVSTEGEAVSRMLSQSEGFALVPWYVSGNNPISSGSQGTQIFTVKLKLRSGVNEDSFNRDTFGLRYVDPNTMPSAWANSVQIVASGLGNYTNTSQTSDWLCGVDFNYTNSDVIGSDSYAVSLTVTDMSSNPLRADVTVNNISLTANSSGTASIQLGKGIYPYRVSLNGYETKNGSVAVNSSTDLTVLLRGSSEIIQAAAAELEDLIVYAPGNSSSYITESIGLPSQSTNGAAIEWESSNPGVLSAGGTVTRPALDTPVTLTATISSGSDYTRQSSHKNVIGKSAAEKNDEEIVSKDFSSLEIRYAPGDAANYVTVDVSLPEIGKNGSYIFWSSSNEDVIDITGGVARPENENAHVTLTALIKRGDAELRKDFNLTVIKQGSVSQTPAQLVKMVADAIEIDYANGDSKTSVTQALSLPPVGREGCTITWTSSKPEVITPYGKVYRPDTDVKVTLTAVVTKDNEKSEPRTFNDINVIKDSKGNNTNPDGGDDLNGDTNLTDAQRVEKDYESLKIIYAPGDSTSSVTQNLTLPLTGEYGSEIYWSTSDASVVRISGEVIRGTAKDIDVTLTATIVSGSASLTKTYPIKVLKIKQDATEDQTNYDEIVNDIANKLEIIYHGKDNKDSISQDITLQTVGAEGATISWVSSSPGIISSNGGVNRQNEDKRVTLTATISYKSSVATKIFNVIVLAKGTASGTQSNLGGTGSTVIPSGDNPLPTPTPSTDPGYTPDLRFHDLGTVEWAQAAILTLAEAGIIQGTSDTTFSPNDSIKRGDFALLIMRMLGLNGTEITDSGFADVAADSYYHDALTLGKQLGILTGVGNNMFEPESFISRQDMMTMTCRALNGLDMLNKNASSDLTRFNDYTQIADYAYSFVSQLVGMELIAGDESGNIAPKANTTRAEAAMFLYRIYVLD